QLAELAVGERRAFLENAERADDGTTPAVAIHADREVALRPLRLRAPQVVAWNLHRAERVFFHPEPVMIGYHRSFAFGRHHAALHVLWCDAISLFQSKSAANRPVINRAPRPNV